MTFNGGTLNTTATFTSARATTLLGQGTFLTDADTTFTLGGAISGSGALIKNGLGTLALTGDATHTGGTTINEGTLQIGAGGTTGTLGGDVLVNATLAFNRSDTLGFAGVISGTGFVRQIGSGMTDLTGDSSGFAGTTLVEAGTLAVNGALCGQVNVLTGARLQGTGVVCDTANAGTVAPGNSIGTLTVDGDYVGNGGVLEIESVLGDDTSSSDRLVVTGATSGSTAVHVLNLNGQGAPTVEGIKIVDIGGASNGAFTLEADYVLKGTPVVVAGAYGYALYKNGISTPTDGDWYLRSSLTTPPQAPDPTDPDPPGPNPTPDPDDQEPSPLYQAGVPLYEAYAQALQGLDRLSTFKQRTGSRVWGEGAVRGEGFWLRLDALKGKFEPERIHRECAPGS